MRAEEMWQKYDHSRQALHSAVSRGRFIHSLSQTPSLARSIDLPFSCSVSVSFLLCYANTPKSGTQGSRPKKCSTSSKSTRISNESPQQQRDHAHGNIQTPLRPQPLARILLRLREGT